MRSVKLMKTAKIGYIIMSLLFCLLGIVLIVIPDFSVPVIAGIFGVLLMLFGMVKIIGYFSKDLFRLAFQYDLASGLLLIVLGIVTILKAENILIFISIVLGIYVLADGLLKIQIALDSRIFGIKQWWVILLSAVVTGAIGCILVVRPSESAGVLVILFGVCLLAEGILNLITVLAAVRIIRHQQPDHAEQVMITKERVWW